MADRSALGGIRPNQGVEVEVTQEMLAAGVSELSALEGEVSKAFLAEAVFRAMALAAAQALESAAA